MCVWEREKEGERLARLPGHFCSLYATVVPSSGREAQQL